MSYKSHQLIKDHDVKWVDLRFTDTKGKQQHVTMPARDALDDEFFEAGKMFDGSSIAGWKGIEASDMILMPDDSTAVLDPFTEEPTLILVCDIIEPSTMQGYERDPRNIAKPRRGVPESNRHRRHRVRRARSRSSSSSTK